MTEKATRSLREFFDHAMKGDLVHLVLHRWFELERRGNEIVVVRVGNHFNMNAVHSRKILGYVHHVPDYLPGETRSQPALHVRTAEGIPVSVPWSAIGELRTFTPDQVYRPASVIEMKDYFPVHCPPGA